MPGARRKRGFSFIELLVAITIVGILIALLLPAVQAGREAARRIHCSKNLSQLILAVHNYQNLHTFYPPGTIDDQRPVRSAAQGYHHNWIVQILPFLEERNAWANLDMTVSVYHPKNAPLARLRLELLQCPSQAITPTPQSSYAGMHHDREAPIDIDNNGVFFLNSRVRYEDITDGSAQTIFLGEIWPEAGGLGWMSGTRATLRNADGFGILAPAAGAAKAIPTNAAVGAILADAEANLKKKLDPSEVVGGFGSPHPGGAQFAYGDGRVAFLSSNAMPQRVRLLANRADGKLLDGDY